MTPPAANARCWVVGGSKVGNHELPEHPDVFLNWWAEANTLSSIKPPPVGYS